jgi:hypothetical protein
MIVLSVAALAASSAMAACERSPLVSECCRKLSSPTVDLGGRGGVYADWALKLPFPDNNAGWLRLYKGENGEARASLMWRWTGPNELIGKKYKGEVQVDGQNISIRYLSTHWIKKAEDQRWIELKGGVEGDAIALLYTEKDGNGKVTDGPRNISGKRIPQLDEKPQVSKIKYGEKIDLMDFSQWELRDPALYNGWSVKDGVLSNRVKRDKDGKVVGKASSLITKRRDFKDFLLTLEVRMPHPGANSGVYLRGNYEIQLLAKHTDKPGVNDMGALYGYVAPKYAAEKEIGEWQQMSICLYKRHVTVTLNGVVIIDNEKVEGCTGGALSADLSAPGPIWLQGDHTDVDIRKFEYTEIRD